MKILFWGSIILIFYAYFGYPIALLTLSSFRNRSVRKGENTPSVSFIITVFNEEARLENKILNTLEHDYPAGKLEIIIASDCSNDGTDEIARNYETRGVKLVRAPERKGKENAQKCSIEAATGEILFSQTCRLFSKKTA